jgi:hypothetical protein
MTEPAEDCSAKGMEIVHKVGSDLSKPKSNNSVPVISVGFKINLQ